MDLSPNPPQTVVEAFFRQAKDPEVRECRVLECGGDVLTYEELLDVVVGLGEEMRKQFGERPTVAIVSENHPYVIVMMLAVWVVGGVVAPMDHHAPETLVRGMLETVEPACVVMPSSSVNAKHVKEWGFSAHVFEPSTSTIPALKNRFINSSFLSSPSPSPSPLSTQSTTSNDVADKHLHTLAIPQPLPSDLCVLLYTSSAHSISALKCVNINHGAIFSNSLLHLAWLRRTYPDPGSIQDLSTPSSLTGLRVLGWGPLSHTIGIVLDIICHTICVGGCYIFGLVPPSYSENAPEEISLPGPKITEAAAKKGLVSDRSVMAKSLLRSAYETKANVFDCIPWILKEFMRLEIESRQEKAEDRWILETLKGFKVVIAGGAAMEEVIIKWADDIGLNLALGIGMTEIAGPLFHGKATLNGKGAEGWPVDECLVRGATLTLRDERGEECDEGELYIKSKYIASGYRYHPQRGGHTAMTTSQLGDAFSVDSEGYTTFRTGDIYAYIMQDDETRKRNLVWKGRREDYIQMGTGELMDPRIVERELEDFDGASTGMRIKRACVLGNMFLKGPSEVVCVIVEIGEHSESDSVTTGKQQRKHDDLQGMEKEKGLLSALGYVNERLPPPLRIPMSRVLVLRNDEAIPINRKGLIWRKVLEERFGERIRGLLRASADGDAVERKENFQVEEDAESNKRMEEGAVFDIVRKVIGIGEGLMRENMGMTFAQLGMDSQMAIRIVNTLNRRFGTKLPLTACHEYVDLTQLTEAILEKTGGNGEPGVQATSNVTKRASRDNEDGDDPVVIVGQALRLPGDINTVDAFWQALVDRRTDGIIGPIPADRWDHASFYEPIDPSTSESSAPQPKLKPGSVTFDKAGFIDVKHFDNAFFGISNIEAMHMSPSGRVAMEMTVEALENANMTIRDVKGTDMGVFVGVEPDSAYSQVLWMEKGYDAYSRHFGTGIAASTVSGRISYFLDTNGPSVSVDTACSSGLVALDSAVKHIKDGDCDTALVCSVNTHLWPGNFAFLSANRMASPHGRCATFTDEADGYAPSEGAVAFVLRRLSIALKDHNEILGVIRSTAVQHNGRSQGLVAPNVKAQTRLQRVLLVKAGLQSSDIDFVEAHGTGTSLGDLIEIQGINETFVASHSKARPLIVGASKTVFGHTESAAGLVGLAKTIRSLREGVVPGLAHLSEGTLNKHIDVDGCPLLIPHASTGLVRRNDEDGKDIPLRAMTLAYGFAGTISGVVVEEHRSCAIGPMCARNASTDSTSYLFVVSSKTATGLVHQLEHYLIFCLQSSEDELANICFTSCTGRDHYRYRLACVVRTMEELVDCLRRKVLASPHLYSPIKAQPFAVFTFAGQGSQYQGMARSLCKFHTEFEVILRRVVEDANEVLGFDLLPYLMDDNPLFTSAYGTIDETHISQTAIFVFQYAMSQWLKLMDITPSGVLPHSVGEIAAAVVAGMLDFHTALEFVVFRSHIMKPKSEIRGAMASVSASAKVVDDLIASLGMSGRVCIAAYNGDNRHVISGDEVAISQFIAICASQDIKCRRLQVNQAFHSHLIESAFNPIKSWFENLSIDLRPPRTMYYSSVNGDVLQATHMTTDYWARQARHPVRFADAAKKIKDGSNIIVDLGPQPSLPVLLHEMHELQSLPIAEMTARRGKTPDHVLLTSLGKLFEYGLTPNFENLYSGLRGSYANIRLPTYAWQKLEHYPSVIPSRHVEDTKRSVCRSFERSWEIDVQLLTVLEDHSFKCSPILPAAAFCTFVVEFLRAQFSIAYDINLQILKPLIVGNNTGDKILLTSDGHTFSICATGGDSTSEICKGSLVPRTSKQNLSPSQLGSPSKHPTILDKTAFYEHLNKGRIHFGHSFRNVQEIRIWDDHVDGCIETTPTENTTHDMTRQLDACLHMFSALVASTPDFPLQDGVFLPSSLSGFRIFRDSFPSSFTCRYHLPLKHEQSSRKLSAEFQVLSHSGELVAECKAYSVAWIPNSVSWEDATKQVHLTPFYHTAWKQATPSSLSVTEAPIIYVGFDSQLATSLELTRPNGSDVLNPAGKLNGHQTLEHARGPTYVFDMTPPFDDFSPSQVNEFALKALGRLRLMYARIIPSRSRVIVMTTNAIRITTGDLDSDENIELGTKHERTTGVYLAGSVIHGIVRVLRNELSTKNVWAVDVASTATSELDAIFKAEASLHDAGESSPVVYRCNREGELLRLVPVLQTEKLSVDDQHAFSMNGTVVIVGLGDIGVTLANELVTKGCKSCVFFSRRCETDDEVQSRFQSLRVAHPTTMWHYDSVDVTSYASVLKALARLKESPEFPPIEMIVQTAAVVKDALLPNISDEQFLDVLQPKAWGAWNLHVACEELCLPLKYFVMLSSVSVPLGNPGQASYVAANSFLDALAAYRSSLYPTAKSISIQLGPWKSRLVDDRKQPDTSILDVFTNKDAHLLLQCLTKNEPVQIMAKFRPDQLRKEYSKDKFFADFLQSGSMANSPKEISSPSDIREVVLNLLKEILEDQENETLDLSVPLTSLGLDSIAMTQLRGGIQNKLQVGVPMSLLMEDHKSAEDVIQHIVQHVV